MIDFGLKDIIDILLVACMLYYIYRLMRSSGTLNAFYGVLTFIIVWILVAQVFEMKLLGNILTRLISVGLLGLIVVFQDEIRRFILTLGSNNRFAYLYRFFSRKASKRPKENPAVMQIVRACDYMSKQRVGALIIIERAVVLDDIAKTGEFIDAAINTQLIKNIFFKNSPLHDGALVVSGQRLKAAACILPVSHNVNIPKEFGLRHRAALGISQQSDAVSVIVSEETGRITIANSGQFTDALSPQELETYLAEIM